MSSYYTFILEGILLSFMKVFMVDDFICIYIYLLSNVRYINSFTTDNVASCDLEQYGSLLYGFTTDINHN